MEPACLSGSGSGPSLRDTPMSARRGLSPAGRGKPHADQAESSTIAEVRRPSAIEQFSVCKQTNSAQALCAALARACGLLLIFGREARFAAAAGLSDRPVSGRGGAIAAMIPAFCL